MTAVSEVGIDDGEDRTEKLFGEKGIAGLNSGDDGWCEVNNPEYYTHIINDRNFERLDNLLQQTSGEVVYGGQRIPQLLRRSVGVDCQGARSCDR
jgi:hypothetical protein